MTKDSKAKSTLNEAIVKVVDSELNKLLEKGANQSVEEYNNQFLKANSNSYDCVIEAAKLMYQLNPETNQSKALTLLTDIANKSFKVTLKVKFKIDLNIFSFRLIRIFLNLF